VPTGRALAVNRGLRPEFAAPRTGCGTAQQPLRLLRLCRSASGTALFSLLGTTYGGDGKSNFALPDLQGRAPMHPGQGPGLSLHDLGETGGSETVTLLESEIPAHSHGLQVSAQDATTRIVAGQQPATGISVSMYGPTPTNTNLSGNALAPAGGDQPHNNMQPYLTF
jgi:microcystin-dependent protein